MGTQTSHTTPELANQMVVLYISDHLLYSLSGISSDLLLVCSENRILNGEVFSSLGIFEAACQDKYEYEICFE